MIASKATPLSGTVGGALLSALALLGAVGCSSLEGTDEEVTTVTDAVSSQLSGFTFKTQLQPRFVGAQNNGGGAVIATATVAQAWETFTLIDKNGGSLVSGDEIFIQAGNGQYFQAANGGGSTLNAASNNQLGWETFRIVKESGTGAIANGDIVGLQAITAGTWVSAENGGGSTVFAYGPAFGAWERLAIGGLSASTPGGGGGTGGTVGNFPARFSAPYVPTWNNTNLVNLSNSAGNKFWTLAFVISNGSCTPTWNGTEGITANSYPSYINSLRGIGGDVIVSFGGAAGKELGQACTSVASLQAAYQQVITQLNLKWIDLDIEGGAESDTASVDRRNKALHNLQVANPGLHISYTLAVDRTGLPASQRNLLSNAKANGVDVNVVNIMAMDYGPCYSDMGQAAIDAASATRGQLSSLGLASSVGVTPMIGVNDVTCENFTTTNAQQLVNYAQANSYISLLAYWAQDADPQGSFINVFKTFH